MRILEKVLSLCKPIIITCTIVLALLFFGLGKFFTEYAMQQRDNDNMVLTRNVYDEYSQISGLTPVAYDTGCTACENCIDHFVNYSYIGNLRVTGRQTGLGFTVSRNKCTIFVGQTCDTQNTTIVADMLTQLTTHLYIKKWNYHVCYDDASIVTIINANKHHLYDYPMMYAVIFHYVMASLLLIFAIFATIVNIITRDTYMSVNIGKLKTSDCASDDYLSDFDDDDSVVQTKQKHIPTWRDQINTNMNTDTDEELVTYPDTHGLLRDGDTLSQLSSPQLRTHYPIPMPLSDDERKRLVAQQNALTDDREE